MKTVRLFIILLITACKTSSLSNSMLNEHPVTFNQFIMQYTTPQLLEDNVPSLLARIKLLHHAPPGGRVDMITFIWKNSEATNLLAAHMCKAAHRGVKIRLLVDSKSGVRPDIKDKFFDNPFHEELYQWLANCDIQVRIFNILPDSLEDLLEDKPGFIHDALNRKKAIEYIISHYGHILASPFNRLNHRKAFTVAASTANGVNGCTILGGRNIGDDYFGWGKHAFLDVDVLVCNHHLKRENSVLNEVQKSFDEVWNSTVPSYTYQKNLNFRYKNIWFARQEQNQFLDRNHPRILEGISWRGDEKADASVRMVPLATEPASPNRAVQGHQIKRAYGWRLAKSSWWNPKAGESMYANDRIRKELLQAIQAEQAHINIESAYLVIDTEIAAALTEAMLRGVKVTIVTNSAFSMTNSLIATITVVNMPFIDEFKQRFPSRFQVYYLTFLAGHTLHAKGAGFRCQKHGGHYAKKFIVGSHNFQPRSSISDLEHAFIWNEKVGAECLKVIGRQNISPEDLAEDPELADQEDIIGARWRWYKKQEGVFQGRNIKLMVEHEAFYREWDRFNLNPTLSWGDLARYLGKRLIRSSDNSEQNAVSREMTEWLMPGFMGFL